jgi:hypothetical protein
LYYKSLLEQAQLVKIVEDRTEWREVASYSNFKQRSTPIGGLVGKVSLEGPLQTYNLGWYGVR